MRIHFKNKLLLSFAVFSSLLAFSTSAFANSTMRALLQKSVALSVAYADGLSYQVIFTPDGRYQSSEGARGSWTLHGEKGLCTKRDADSNKRGRAGKKSCGELPKDKKLGDVWVMPSTRGPAATISIVKLP